MATSPDHNSSTLPVVLNAEPQDVDMHDDSALGVPIRDDGQEELRQARSTAEIQQDEPSAHAMEQARRSSNTPQDSLVAASTGMTVAEGTDARISTQDSIQEDQHESIDTNFQGDTMPTKEGTPGESNQPAPTEHVTLGNSAKSASVPHTIPNPADVSGSQLTDSTHTPNVPSVKIPSHSGSRATSVVAQNHNEVHTTGAPTRVYLKEQVNDYLLEGMRWLALTRPENGLLALGNYLCSADTWRKRSGNETKGTADFQRYWNQYQTWLSQGNVGKTEQDFNSST